MDSLRGQFLVASPHLPDENFFRTVVFMIQHEEDGALGVIVNRPSTQNVQDLWQARGQSCSSQAPVYVGGPVPGALIALHDELEFAEFNVIPGIFVTTQEDLIDELVVSERRFKLFNGYAGWAPGQLEGELEMGGWMVCDSEAEEVLDPSHDLWNRIARKIGIEIMEPALRGMPVVDDPSVN